MYYKEENHSGELKSGEFYEGEEKPFWNVE